MKPNGGQVEQAKLPPTTLYIRLKLCECIFIALARELQLWFS